MTLLQTIQDNIQKFVNIDDSGRYVIMPTFSLYPSCSLVEVYIEGGDETISVSDGGGAFTELDCSGSYDFDAMKILKSFVKKHGLEMDDRGWIHSKRIPYGRLQEAITVVSSVSLEAAEMMVSKLQIPTKRNFKSIVQHEFKFMFQSDFQQTAKIVGASNHLHTFDGLVHLKGGQSLIFDAVVPDANSINSAVVSHLDVKQSNNGSYVQRIIYDDNRDWSSAELSLLNVGATTVSHAAMISEIERIAA